MASFACLEETWSLYLYTPTAYDYFQSIHDTFSGITDQTSSGKKKTFTELQILFQLLFPFHLAK